MNKPILLAIVVLGSTAGATDVVNQDEKSYKLKVREGKLSISNYEIKAKTTIIRALLRLLLVRHRRE
jgi:hypothetical protein